MASEEEGQNIAIGAAPGCRVVICDDVEDFRTLIVAVLARVPGLRVVGQASTGREAVELAAMQQPDVVLLDVSMPEMDGIEALPLIRSAAPQSRVLVLTGFTAPDIREQALAGGAAGYMEKGTPSGELVAAIQVACRG